LATGIMARASEARCNATKAKASLTQCCGSNGGWAVTYPGVWLSSMRHCLWARAGRGDACLGRGSEMLALFLFRQSLWEALTT